MTDDSIYIQYSGPEELREQWDALVGAYVNAHTKSFSEPAPAYCIKALNALNTLTFGTEDQKREVIEKACKPIGSRKEFTHQLSPLANDLCELALFVSKVGAKGENRPLQDKVVEEIVKQWIEVEKSFGLYPPRSVADKKGIKDDEKKWVNDRRQALIASSKGGLLFNLIHSLADKTIQSRIAPTKYNYRERTGTAFEDNIDEMAQRFFTNSLFSYELDQGTKLISYVYSLFKNYFNEQIYKKSSELNNLSSLDVPLYSDDERTMADFYHELQTDGRTDLDEKYERVEKLQKIKTALGILDEFSDPETKSDKSWRTKAIISQYTGLDGTLGGRSLEEIAQEFGITTERVRQLKEAGLARIKEELENQDTTLKDIAADVPELAKRPLPNTDKKEWVSLSSAFGNMAIRGYTGKAYEHIKRHYIDKRLGEGLSQEAAEEDMHKNYISIVTHYRERTNENDPLIPHKSSIKLSPQAVKDMKQELQILEEAKGIGFIRERWKLNKAWTPKIQQIVKIVREKEIERLAAEYKLPLDADKVLRQVDAEYIYTGKSSPDRHGNTNEITRIYPAAIPDIDREMQMLRLSDQKRKVVTNIARDLIRGRWKIHTAHTERVYQVIKEVREQEINRVAAKYKLSPDSQEVINRVNEGYIYIGKGHDDKHDAYRVHPAAMDDLDKAMEKLTLSMEKKGDGSKSVDFILDRFNLSHSRSTFIKTTHALKRARDIITDQIAKERGLPHDDESITEEINRNYIRILRSPNDAYDIFRIYPAAMDEVDRQMQKFLQNREAAQTPNSIIKSWGLKPHLAGKDVRQIIRDLREKEIDRVAAEYNLPRDAEKVISSVNENYIHIGRSPNDMYEICKIYPSALTDVNKAVQEKFPDRTPQENTEQRSR